MLLTASMLSLPGVSAMHIQPTAPTDNQRSPQWFLILTPEVNLDGYTLTFDALYHCLMLLLVNVNNKTEYATILFPLRWRVSTRFTFSALTTSTDISDYSLS